MHPVCRICAGEAAGLQGLVSRLPRGYNSTIMSIEINLEDISEAFVRAGGPGGQNVNKVSSAVQLRFRLAGATVLHEETRARARKLAGKRWVKDTDEILIIANRFRDQPRNRADALARLQDILDTADIVPVRRRPTKATKASKARRVDSKTIRGKTKSLRGKVSFD
jgi:ribosome-associated protein